MPQRVLASLSFALSTLALAQTPPPVQVETYCQQLVHHVDLWNGGLDGLAGMGAYQTGFTGFFQANLARDWEQTGSQRITSVAQARAIYMNLEAYRASKAQRFRAAAQKGAEFYLNSFWDKQNGGFYWEADRQGNPTSRSKQGYGNVFGLFTLAQLYAVLQDPQYLDLALQQLEVLEKHFVVPDHPGIVLPGFNFDFSEVEGYNNIDTFTHYFEALLALHDVLSGEPQQHVASLIQQAGNSLERVLYHNETGHTDQGYVAYNYDANWQPALEPYTRNTQWTTARQASTGHNIELAYLISRAVERGFNPAWLNTAQKLKKFVEVHTLNPDTGAMQYEVTDYDGTPLQGNPDNDFYVWWANSEAARAFLHFAVVRKDDTLQEFKRQENFIQNHFVDSQYGGWYQNVHVGDLRVFDGSKGNIWTMNYHETMLAAEVLRLAAQYPEAMGNQTSTCLSPAQN
ncbi:AGE family epimerase/isomerase [Deinococcus roseus]|uniref:N-acylglucosamine 2-epimerase n=1 Tax=Deinococcus roseus TaxID=392414 RepID=A0ABQ2DDA8_9DEIO|nr:AGE family epimerase/isomerase [Deinococcus roseus]GGJ51718.1 hypothetical protein GCM10008938_42180 [Deinococcus roseus]